MAFEVLQMQTVCCAYIIEMPAAVLPQKSKQTVPRNLKEIKINFQITL